MAQAGSDDWVALAGLLALMTGLWLFIARVIGLGFIADFLSRTVLVGFLTGVGIQVAGSQLPEMLGFEGSGLGPIQNMIADLKQIPEASLPTLGITVAGLIVIYGGKRLSKKFPGALVAVLGAIAVSYFLDFQALGVAVLGDIQGGLPPLGLPDVSLSDIPPLISVSLSMFIIILAQSAATSRAYAVKYGEKFDENVDLVGLGMANLGAGLSGTFVVSGSPTKTQVIDGAGGRSQISQVVTSVIVLIVLLFLTKPLAYMPTAILATVVFTIGLDLIDVKGMQGIYKERPVEFWVALITTLMVVFVGVKEGIVWAIILSILVHLRHGYKPKDTLLATDEKGLMGIREFSLKTKSQAMPGLMLYRFTHDMYYANSALLSEEVLNLVKDADPPLRWLCIDFPAVDDVDFSAAATLRELHGELNKQDIKLIFSQVADNVRAELDVSGITDLVGTDAFFESMPDVIVAYKKTQKTNASSENSSDDASEDQ